LETTIIPRIKVCTFLVSNFRLKTHSAMSHFRCYLLNSADQIVSVDSVDAESDARAMEAAAQLIMTKHANYAAIEVWDRARRVGRVLGPEPHVNVEPLLNIPGGLKRNRS
jgi:hypothetical protein